MQRLVSCIFLVCCVLTSSSCSTDYKIEAEFGDLFTKHNIHNVIGIKVFAYKKSITYAIKNGKPYKTDNLPDPPIPSHQNSELSIDNYNFLPKNIEYKYVGPQLISPDKTITVASCISKNTPLHPADTFLIIENESNRVIYKEDLEKGFYIKGIAWSPRSDIFTILTSQSTFKRNILRSISGHPVSSIDYYLSFYKKNGQILFRKKIISSLIDGSAEIIWMQDDYVNGTVRPR